MPCAEPRSFISLRWSAEAFRSYPSWWRLQHVFYRFALCSMRTGVTNPMLTERAASSSGLEPEVLGLSCQSSQASLSRTLQELTWRTGDTAKCFLQQVAWRTALLCKLDWTQGCPSVPWRPSRPVLPFCPFWLHTLICLNSPELHCWLSSHPHCIKMLGLCFRVYVRRSQGAGTDHAKDSMPGAFRRGQGLPSDLPKDSLCLHLVVIECKFVVRKVFGMTLPKTAYPGHAIVS